MTVIVPVCASIVAKRQILKAGRLKRANPPSAEKRSRRFAVSEQSAHWRRALPGHDILGGMAKDTDKKQKAAKEPGRIKQMVQVYRTTKKHDRNLTLALLLSFIAPILIAVLLAVFLPGGWISAVIWIVTGILIGVLLVMIVLGRRAETSAYRQIEGQPGAVGAVVQGALRRSWRGSEVPVAMNRNRDAVYRVVGRGGVVLIGEGPVQRTRRMLNDEERKIKRFLPNVPITQLTVGPDPDSVPLPKLSKTLVRMKSVLRRQEVVTVHNRLVSMQASPVGIPKGIDPNKVRPPRPR